MSIAEYLPFILAGSGMALRFWMSRPGAEAGAPVVHMAKPVKNVTQSRSATPVVATCPAFVPA